MVAMNVWPTDASDGSVANEARWRKMARHWAPTGVAAGVGSELVPSLAMPNLTVRSGACWVDGHYCELTSDQVITATANGLAVVRFDPANNTAELLWRDGATTPTQNPTGTWELAIARTTGSVLADLRVNSLVASQTIPRFANAGTRASKIPAPYLNQTTILDDRPGIIQYWTGGAWADATPPVPPSPVPAGTYVQYGNTVMTTDVGGNCGVAFPTVFSGDATVVASEASGLGGNVAINNTNNATVGFNVRYANTNPVDNGMVRVHWIAAGPR